jgi:flavin reductase (DIM6/NTAB) family NADH-FMN oxidoreductase RutF
VKRELNPKMLYFGTPIVLISSLNDDGSTNIAPMSSAWWVGRTAMLGLSVNSQTVRNLQRRPRLVLNLVDSSMVDAVDRLALLTGRPDVPEYKRARGYTYQPDKYRAAGLTPTVLDAGSPTAVAESLIQMEGQVRAIHDIDEDDSGLRALEVKVLHTHVDESLLMTGHPGYIDPVRWQPLIMKFTEYFAGGELARPSSLAKGWGMPQPQPGPAAAIAVGATAARGS